MVVGLYNFQLLRRVRAARSGSVGAPAAREIKQKMAKKKKQKQQKKKTGGAEKKKNKRW